MTSAGEVRFTFHQHTFFELTTAEHTIFIDPVFSHERRGRRVPDGVRSANYVFATSMSPWFEDTLDVLDTCEATFVAAPRLCRYVSSELELAKKRLLDLEPWERASEEAFRVTAVPVNCSIGMEGSIEEGASLVKDVSNVFPRASSRLPLVGNLLGGLMPMLDSGLRFGTNAVESVGTFGPQRSFAKMTDMFGVDVGRITGGRPGLGYFFEVKGYPSVLHLADGVHSMTGNEEIEDIAEVCSPDVVVMHVEGMSVEPIVRTVRILEPKTVLFYRARDPYAGGRRGQTLPVQSFMMAVQEGAPKCEAVHMKKGDSYILDKTTS